MRGSDRYCLGPTLMRKRSREGRGGRRGGGQRWREGGGGWAGWGEGNWKVRERLVCVGELGWGGLMNGGPHSVTDATANYSWSALRCTAGGANSVVEWPQNIPPPSICIKRRNHCRVHNLEQLRGVCCAIW